MGPRLEVAVLLDGGEEQSDVLVSTWDADKDLCVDVSIVSLFCGGQFWGQGKQQRAEEKKLTRYERG